MWFRAKTPRVQRQGMRRLWAKSWIPPFSVALCLWGFLALATSEPVAFLDRPETLHAPFPAGERLRYDIYWEPPKFLEWIIGDITAGEIEIQVEESVAEGRETLTISAKASTQGFVRSRFLEVDDRFESIIDRTDFRSYRFKKVIREGDKNQKDILVEFDYERQRVEVEKVDLRKDPPQLERKVFEGISGPVTDVLSVFYIARLRKLSPGQRYSIQLADEKEPQEVVVSVERREKVKTRLDQFEAVRISTEGGFFNQGGDFFIWYSTNDHRYPVRFQADAKIGKVYGELVGIDSGRVSRGVIRLGKEK